MDRYRQLVSYRFFQDTQLPRQSHRKQIPRCPGQQILRLSAL